MSTRAPLLVLLTVVVTACGDVWNPPGVDEASSAITVDPSMPPNDTEGDIEPPTTGATSTSGEPGSTSDGGDESNDNTGEIADPDDEARCGNGILEPEHDEECDNGKELNANDAECTEACKKAICGDGFVQPIIGEVCDDGPANVDETDLEKIPYNGCGKCLQAGHWCGDGTLQPDHEDCDWNPENSATCDDACRWEPFRRIFLSSISKTGNFAGLAQADINCQYLADNAEQPLPGSYRAWLLESGSSLAARFPEYIDDETTLFGLVDGTPVANGLMDLVDGPSVAISLDENRGEPGSLRVWTNITSTGEATEHDCMHWQHEDSLGFFGFSGEPATWTQALKDPALSTKPCSPPGLHFYCLQVADD